MTSKNLLLFNDQVLLDDIVLASTFSTKLLGYMFQKKPKSKGILFRQCNALHSYFMHFDLDLYFLDAQCRLVQICPAFTPNRTIHIPSAVHVLEVPSGLLASVPLTLGVTFRFLPQKGHPAPTNPDAS